MTIAEYLKEGDRPEETLIQLIGGGVAQEIEIEAVEEVEMIQDLNETRVTEEILGTPEAQGTQDTREIRAIQDGTHENRGTQDIPEIRGTPEIDMMIIDDRTEMTEIEIAIQMIEIIIMEVRMRQLEMEIMEVEIPRMVEILIMEARMRRAEMPTIEIGIMGVRVHLIIIIEEIQIIEEIRPIEEIQIIEEFSMNQIDNFVNNRIMSIKRIEIIASVLIPIVCFVSFSTTK